MRDKAKAGESVRWLVAAALAAGILSGGCGGEPPPQSYSQPPLRRFLVAYQDGTRDTIRARAFYERGWGKAVEFVGDGFESVGYITRPCSVVELP